jgi:hypothetical protein
MIDEPLITPYNPGEAVVRIAQLTGALTASPQNAASGNHLAALDAAQAQLIRAVADASPEAIRSALATAQSAISAVYDEFSSHEALLQALGFPLPSQVADPYFIAAPDEKSVVATYTLRGKQVLTSLAFNYCPGATGYWLHNVRYWQEDGEVQRIEDPIISSNVPIFPRVRLPIGKQVLRLKSRNLSVSAISDEFEIEVPALI